MTMSISCSLDVIPSTYVVPKSTEAMLVIPSYYMHATKTHTDTDDGSILLSVILFCTYGDGAKKDKSNESKEE